MNGIQDQQTLEFVQNVNLLVGILKKILIRKKQKIYRQTHKEEIAIRKKKYCQDKKEEIATRMKKYYQDNKESLNLKSSERGKEYYRKNKEKISERIRKYQEENKEHLAKKQKEYNEKNHGKKLEYHRKYNRENKEQLNNLRNIRRKLNPSIVFHDKIRSCICSKLDLIFKNKSSNPKIQNKRLQWKYPGCNWTINDLIVNLESKFKEGMNWYNRGKIGWEIDHIIPTSNFNILSVDDPKFLECWGLENLQPLWGIDNRKKYNN